MQLYSWSLKTKGSACIVLEYCFYKIEIVEQKFYFMLRCVGISSILMYTAQLNEKHREGDSHGDDLANGASYSESDMESEDRETMVNGAVQEVELDEAEIAKKVLNNLISSSVKETPSSLGDDSELAKGEEGLKLPNTANNKLPDELGKSSDITKPKISNKRVLTTHESAEKEKDLDKTIFISNLPFDIDNEEVKQRLSVFGQVQSFLPVLHQVTKYVNVSFSISVYIFHLINM